MKTIVLIVVYTLSLSAIAQNYLNFERKCNTTKISGTIYGVNVNQTFVDGKRAQMPRALHWFLTFFNHQVFDDIHPEMRCQVLDTECNFVKKQCLKI